MLLFFDIDGTIWNYENYIPESTRESIRRAKENGHRCFLNSGRSRAFIHKKELLALDFDGIVSACGTMIEYHGETVYQRMIEPDLAEWTVRTTREHGFKSILEGPKYLYMDEEEFGSDSYAVKVKQEMGDRMKRIDENWGKWEIQKLSSATGGADREGCMEKLRKDYDFMIHNSEVMEIVPKGFHKGVGIEKVCELLGESIRDTFAFGDGVNDIEMLRSAEVGIVMGNGAEKAKECADYVTTDLMDDGIRNAMEHFGLI